MCRESVASCLPAGEYSAEADAEQLRDLGATIEDLETERAAIPVDEQEHQALMLEARRLRRDRREFVLVAVAAGTPVRVTAEAAHVTEGAVTWLVEARAPK